MSNQFKAGDLALLINASSRNNFKTVELVEFLGAPDLIPLGETQLRNTGRHGIWLVRACREPIIFSKKISSAAGVSSSMEAPVAERNLMPLRGDFEPEREMAREVVE